MFITVWLTRTQIRRVIVIETAIHYVRWWDNFDDHLDLEPCPPFFCLFGGRDDLRMYLPVINSFILEGPSPASSWSCLDLLLSGRLSSSSTPPGLSRFWSAYESDRQNQLAPRTSPSVALSRGRPVQGYIREESSSWGHLEYRDNESFSLSFFPKKKTTSTAISQHLRFFFFCRRIRETGGFPSTMGIRVGVSFKSTEPFRSYYFYLLLIYISIRLNDIIGVKVGLIF